MNRSLIEEGRGSLPIRVIKRRRRTLVSILVLKLKVPAYRAPLLYSFNFRTFTSMDKSFSFSTSNLIDIDKYFGFSTLSFMGFNYINLSGWKAGKPLTSKNVLSLLII